jgi:hypothetical protein
VPIFIDRGAPVLRLAFHPFNSSAAAVLSGLANFPDASVSLRTLFAVDLLDQLLRGRIVDGEDGLEPARRPAKNPDRYRMLNPTAHPRPGREHIRHDLLLVSSVGRGVD